MIEIVWELVIHKKEAYYAPGNHCNKLYRFFLGRNVTVAHGLETTVAEYEALPSHKQNMIKEKFITLYEQSLYITYSMRKGYSCVTPAFGKIT